MDEKWPNEQFFALVEKELEEGKTVKIRLKGNSMFPLLRSGRDSVILVKSPAHSLKPMDVVLFRYCGNFILHRIIKKDGARLLLQGDGVISAVERCTVDDVVGKVVKVCRSSGRTISVDSWRWIFASRLWRCSKIIRVLLLKLFG
jgi:phage repressor protein C with HTH and peptisase S24 domain